MPVFKIPFKLSLAFILVLALGQTVRAQTCESLFHSAKTTPSKANLEEAFLDEKNNEAFTNILADEDLPFAKQILNQARVRDDVSFRQALIETLRAHHYTEDMISARIAQAESKTAHTEQEWRQILGDLSLEETHSLFYGGNIKSISPTSLIGQYLAKTKAQFSFRSFPKEVGSSEQGPQRLVIAVSRSSFKEFRNLILSNPHYMSVVGHANVLHNGQFYSYMGGPSSRIESLSLNTPIPLVLFKTSEAQRLNRYMNLTTKTAFLRWDHALKQPWKIKGYCGASGFDCCTQWLGNIPIGDQLVSEYSFPPSDEAKSRKPKIRDLKPYEPTNDKQRLLSTVWKSPGHQQFADVIGQREANINGEMASPGYVIHTLLGPTSAERVPVVFIMTKDHTLPLPETLNLNAEVPR